MHACAGDAKITRRLDRHLGHGVDGCPPCGLDTPIDHLVRGTGDRAAEAIEGTLTSLVNHPVVLAVHPGSGEGRQQAPVESVAHHAVDRREPGGMGLPGIGSLRMAMPRGSQSDATSLAAQAVASALTRSAGPLTAADAALPRVGGERPHQRCAGQDGTASARQGHRPRHRHRTDQGCPHHRAEAVPTDQGRQGAKVMAIVPGGPTPIADYPLIRLAANLVSAEASEGAASSSTS